MKYRSAVISIIALVLLLPAGASGRNDKDKEQLALSLDNLRNEIQVLERQISTMQQGMDRNSGQVTTLINQIADTVNTIKLTQSRVTESSNAALTSVAGLGDQISAVNLRMDQLSNQIAEVKKLIQGLPKLPAISPINPGDPDQLFAAGIADYHRSNYDLAFREFTQYLDAFPDTLMACSAQYWVGMTLVAQGKLNDAVTEFQKVIDNYPKCDRLAMAHYEEGLALQQLGQGDAAQKQFLFIIKYYKGSGTAELAKQALNKMQ